MKFLSYIFLFFSFYTSSSQIVHKRSTFLLGSPFEITLVGKDTLEINTNIDIAISELKRIENLISDWIPTSQVSEINRNAGIKPVVVPSELIDLIERSIKISKLTDGAFDITYASMDKIWKFDGSMKSMPTPEEIRKSVEKVGFKNIIINKENSSVYLKIKGMKMGFGGIGQGYIADKIKELLVSKGIVSGIINVSGDISTWGRQPNGDQWRIAIKNPLNKSKVFATFPLEDIAVETSGSYEKYVVFNNKKYSHIIDTRTGYPVQGVSSVTVFAKTTELADALATGIFVMGVEVGIDLINQLPGVGCIMVDDNGKIYSSKSIDINNYKNEN